ncbi:MAG TPA: universal stress protein [Polyangiales bacterium]
MRVQQRPLFRGILFATRSGELLPPDLARVRALCELFGARLHVLRVLPALGRPNALFAGHDTADTLMRSQHAAQLRSDTEAICQGAFGHSGAEISVRRGDFEQVVAQTARELGADVIVLRGAHAHRGSEVVAVARAAHVPVMVAELPHAHAIVAATDLSDPRYPVLMRGVELAQRFDASLTAVHNAEPFAATPPTMAAGAVVPPHASVNERLFASARERMRAVVDELGVDFDGVVVRRFGTAEAILEEARRMHADLVVVGTRPRPWLLQKLSRSVAAAVIDRAARSVMVVPIPAPALRVELG